MERNLENTTFISGSVNIYMVLHYVYTIVSYTRVHETGAECLRSTDSRPDMGQLFVEPKASDVTITNLI